MDMSGYVGIDVSKDRLDVCILPQDERFSVGRNAGGLGELVERLRPVVPKLVVVEATGGFEKVVAASVAAAALPMVVVNPAQVRHYAQALGKRAKTDPIDAYVLARFASDVRPEARELPDEMTQFLSDLVSRRRQIVEMLGAERQREQRASLKRVRQSIARLVKALEKELSEIDQQIDDAVRGSPVWREKENLLASVPGVGPQTARVLLAELPELGTMGRREISSLAGLAPFVRQSGMWRGKSRIGGGRKTVRSALFIAGMVAARFNPVLKAFYKRLLESGKAKLPALVAVARKLLTILNAVLRDRKPWQTVDVPV
jgi:transposase